MVLDGGSLEHNENASQLWIIVKRGMLYVYCVSYYRISYYISYGSLLSPQVGCNANLPLLLCSETVGEAIKWQTLSSSSVIDVYSLCSFSNIFLEGFACKTDLPKGRGYVENASKIKIVCGERKIRVHMYAVPWALKPELANIAQHFNTITKINNTFRMLGINFLLLKKTLLFAHVLP